MHEKVLTRGPTLSRLRPEACDIFGDLIEIQEDYDHSLLKFSDVHQTYAEIHSFGRFHSECVNVGDLGNLFAETVAHAENARRFSVRIGDEALTGRLREFSSEIGKMSAAHMRQLLTFDDSAAIEPLLPQAFYRLVEYILTDWHAGQEIYQQALEVARGECRIESVDDDTYYDWLANRINLIEDYAERAESLRCAWDYGRSQLFELGHRYLRSPVICGPSPSRKEPLHLYELHNTRGQAFVLARYRDAIQILSRDMAEILGEWRGRKELPQESWLAPLERIDDIPYWHYSPEDGMIKKLSRH